MFGSRQMLAKCSTDVINIAGDDIKRERVIRYLGAFLDEYLTFKDHIKRKCRVAMMILGLRPQTQPIYSFGFGVPIWPLFLRWFPISLYYNYAQYCKC